MCDRRSDKDAASPWVRRFMRGAPAGASMLDVACGAGRHLRLARSLGFDATGIDRDLSGVADLSDIPGLELIAADLESGASVPFSGRRYAVVVVTNYLWRPLLPHIVSAVAPDGLLIYETFAVGNEHYGRPRNPEFLLRPGELLSAVDGHLVTLAYEQVKLEQPERLVQRICAAGPEHAWVHDGAPAS